VSNYEKLEVWKGSMLLARDVYAVTKGFPKEELYGLTSQIRRAAISVPANIAEGMGRQYKKDTIQFLFIARGSLYELKTLLQFATITDILRKEVFLELGKRINITLKLLNGLIRYMENSNLK
jgi:four helix bundle protein